MEFNQYNTTVQRGFIQFWKIGKPMQTLYWNAAGILLHMDEKQMIQS